MRQVPGGLSPIWIRYDDSKRPLLMRTVNMLPETIEAITRSYFVKVHPGGGGDDRRATAVRGAAPGVKGARPSAIRPR
jgi:hypothetical protein